MSSDKSKKDGIDKLLLLCDKIIEDPKKSIYELADAQKKNVAWLLVAVGILNPIVIAPAFIMAPTPLLLTALLWRYFKKKNQDKQEKEIMYREIIKKQQAIIQKLESTAKGQKDEIKNLKEALSILEQLEKAAA